MYISCICLPSHVNILTTCRWVVAHYGNWDAPTLDDSLADTRFPVMPSISITIGPLLPVLLAVETSNHCCYLPFFLNSRPV